MPLPAETLYPSESLLPAVLGAQISVKEPESWLACNLNLDGGRVLRFGPDEEADANLPQGLGFNTQMPGGYADGGIVLPRPPKLSADMASLFANASIYGPGLRSAYEGRVKGVPQVGVSEIRLELEGHVAHLDDNEFFRETYIDGDLSRWGPGSVEWQIAATNAGVKLQANGGVISDADGAALATNIVGQWPAFTRNEQWYFGDVPIGRLLYRKRRGNPPVMNTADGNWWATALLSTDALVTDYDDTGNIGISDMASFSELASTEPGERMYARVLLQYQIAVTSGGDDHPLMWELYVLGEHGLEVFDTTAGGKGLRGDDILEHALAHGAPQLDIEQGGIDEPYFVIPQLVADGTVRSVVEAVTLYAGSASVPNDWGVYDGGFFWRAPGTYGRTWRVRRDDVAEVTEGGPTTDERCYGVAISFQDGSGRSYTAGPPGSGATYESDELVTSDPSNPAVRVPERIKRRDIGISYPDAAIAIGAMLLREQNDRQRRLVLTQSGTIRDDAGNEHPSWAMRAGDQALIEDDPEAPDEVLPINSTAYEHDGKTVTANLGATPQGFETLLAQLEAVTPR